MAARILRVVAPLSRPLGSHQRRFLSALRGLAALSFDDEMSAIGRFYDDLGEGYLDLFDDWPQVRRGKGVTSTAKGRGKGRVLSWPTRRGRG